ncbi:MAG: hypothetical protein R2725_11825 [Solirubrobacterales bacterium]
MATTGSRHGLFSRALDAGDFAAACAYAHDLPVVDLGSALHLTLLAASTASERYGPMAVRWLSRLAAEAHPSLAHLALAAQLLQDVGEGATAPSSVETPLERIIAGELR